MTVHHPPFAGSMPMRSRIRGTTAEFAALIAIVFCLATQAVQQVLIGDGDQPGGSQVIYLVFMAMYLVVGILTLRRSTSVLGVLSGSTLTTLIILMPLISILWSADRSLTLQRSIALLGSSLVGVYLVTRLDLKQLILLLGIVYVLAAVGSLIAAVAIPSIGVMRTEAWNGTWRGLYPHKNALGAAMAVGGIVLLYGLTLARGRLRLFFLFGLAVTMVMLVQARSTTSLVTFLFVVMLMVWAWMLQRRPTAMTALSLAGVGVLLVLSVQTLATVGLDGLFALLGKSADISGRIPLWELCVTFIRERPWLGRGYEAFWILGSQQYDYITAQLRYAPFYSHNGVIETLLNGGALTLALVVLALLAGLWRGFLLMVRERRLYASFPFVFFVYFITSNLTESRILYRNDLIWVLFVALGLLLGQQVKVRWIAGERQLR